MISTPPCSRCSCSCSLRRRWRRMMTPPSQWQTTVSATTPCTTSSRHASLPNVACHVPAGSKGTRLYPWSMHQDPKVECKGFGDVCAINSGLEWQVALRMVGGGPSAPSFAQCSKPSGCGTTAFPGWHITTTHSRCLHVAAHQLHAPRCTHHQQGRPRRSPSHHRACMETGGTRLPPTHTPPGVLPSGVPSPVSCQVARR